MEYFIDPKKPGNFKERIFLNLYILSFALAIAKNRDHPLLILLKKGYNIHFYKKEKLQKPLTSENQRHI